MQKQQHVLAAYEVLESPHTWEWLRSESGGEEKEEAGPRRQARVSWKSWLGWWKLLHSLPDAGDWSWATQTGYESTLQAHHYKVGRGH